jgi:myo-inositol catabolism protein IolC
MSDLSKKLDAVLNDLPLAVALVDPTGRFVGKSGRMSGMLGDFIPSRSARDAPLWRFTDSGGSIIRPDHWPAARALRGETLPEGMTGTWRKDQEHQVKVIALPFPDPEVDLAAITFVQLIDRERRAREGVHNDLEERLLLALVRAIRDGMSAPDLPDHPQNRPF